MTDDKAEAARLHTELINVVHAWEAQRNRADEAEADRDRAVSALNEHGRSAVGISGDLEDGINADHLMATAERDGLLAALAATEADRDRARDAAVALEQENAAARALHHSPKGALCVECCEDWPCATIEALGGETP